MFKKIAIASVLLLAVAAFELHPAVEQGRAIIPEDVYSGKTCDCLCILASRPWYSTINYWFGLFLITAPAWAFFLPHQTTKRQKLLSAVLCFCLSYLFFNLAVHLSWDIRNAPFVVSSDLEVEITDQKTWDMGCANIADGASMMFALFLGWLPAALYTGIWLFMRYKIIPFLRSKKLFSFLRSPLCPLFI